MQYNYDFHLHYQLVDASQMLGMATMCVGMGSSIFLPAPHLIWGIDYQIRGK